MDYQHYHHVDLDMNMNEITLEKEYKDNVCLNSWRRTIYNVINPKFGQIDDVNSSSFNGNDGNSSFADFAEYTWIIGDQIFIISLFVVIIIVVGAAFIITRCLRQKNAVRGLKSGPKTRFRKRDKVLFYGKKMLRKVRSISSGAGKKKKIISRITKKFLQSKKDTSPTQLQVLEPSNEYLQEDVSPDSDQRLPPEVSYMLQNIRMFGVFEKPLFLELCKHLDCKKLSAGEFLFKIGEMDENFYVVQSGKLNVFISECDGSTVNLKIVKEGESITSLLSFTDVLTGHPQPYKTVSAQAIVDCIVLKLPVTAFQEVFEQYPESFIRVIHIIMVRLNRVTFTALHQHLGLSAELVTFNDRNNKPQNLSPIRRQDESTRQTPDLLDSESTPQSHTSSSYNLSKGDINSILVAQRHLKKRHSAPIHIGDGNYGGNNSSSYPNQYGQYQRNSEAPDEETFGDVLTSLQESYEIALDAFKTGLGLEDISLIKDIVHIKDFPPGALIVKEDAQQDCGFIFVVSGLLTLSQHETERDVLLYNALPGEFIGGLAVLTGEPSVFTIKAKHHSRLGFISSTDFHKLIELNPKVVLHVAHIVVKRLSPFVRQIDFAVDWAFLEAGKALYRQGDESDSTYIVLSGRVRSVITRGDGKKQLVSEYGRGDLIGIVECLTRTRRSTTCIAVRDTELAKLPEGLLNAIKLKYPIVVTRLINLLGHRILGSWQTTPRYDNSQTALDSKPSFVNFSTVAIVAITDDVPVSNFSYELVHSISAIGNTLRLTSDYVKTILGGNILDKVNEYKLNAWLAQQEDKHRIVLYVCDPTMTFWTSRCIRQADCILIVGLGDKDPSIGKIEKQLENIAVRTQKELVLLHKEGGERPSKTALWLNARSWCSSHHHIRCPKRMFSKKIKNENYFAKLMEMEPNIHSDFSRLARWLTGTSVGLVLGGGGARGASHIGMIKAIQESGIPIDMIGGVSIGSFMGALWCTERNITTVTQKARDWSKKMTQWWRQLLDLTYPVTSMFSGAGFNQTIKETFGDVQIEDLWLPFFCVTTNISSSCMRIHTHADVMKERGARFILAVDVGSQDDTDLTNYGDSLSGWWLLYSRWTSYFRSESSQVKVPNLPDIQSRLAYVSCVRQLEEVRNSDYCHYMRPPIDRFKTLQFGSFDEIKDVGYHYGKTYFDGMMRGTSDGNILPLISGGILGHSNYQKAYSRNSDTDDYSTNDHSYNTNR